ncbi:MAG: hypothetical protein AAF639_25470 [Chloroflexota bacterium]
MARRSKREQDKRIVDRKELHKCRQAIKILEQYERLAEKQAAKIPPDRLADLNQLRDTGLITVGHLPASLHKKFPSEFNKMTLAEIRAYLQELSSLPRRGD